MVTRPVHIIPSDSSSCRNEQEEYEKQVLEELRQEALRENPVLLWMHGVHFLSTSRGRGRKPRRYPREITLLQYNGDHEKGRWRYWSGEDRDDHGRCPWDEWATEVFGDDFLCRLSDQGVHEDDYLRSQVMNLLREYRGKF